MAEETAQESGIREPSPEYTFPEPNPQEAMFFFNIIKNVTNLPDINWDNVASDSGFKNAAVAKKRFYQIKQKLGLDNNLSGCATPKPSRKTKATGNAAALDTAQEATASDPTRRTVASPKVNKRRKAIVKTERQGQANTWKDQLDHSPTKTVVKAEDTDY